MQLIGKIIDITKNIFNNKVRVTLEIDEDILQYLEQLHKLKEEKLSIEIKKYREKRSLDANAYCWVLLQKMAEILKKDKDEVYVDMICKYGVFTHYIVKPSAVERTKEVWRAVRELGEVTVNGKTGIQLQCYFGSSTYDTKEMSVLIDGIVGECKEMGIQTLTPAEIEDMKRKWFKHEQKK